MKLRSLGVERSIRNPSSLLLLSDHVRLTCVVDTVVAVRFDGAAGGGVTKGVGVGVGVDGIGVAVGVGVGVNVVALATLEYPEFWSTP